MADEQLPAHASPALPPIHSPQAHSSVRSIHDYDIPHDDPPPTFLSPAFTPPATPGTGTPAVERDASSVPIDSSASAPAPKLVETLPHVACEVRARIPTTSGQEMWLHLYHNDVDNKEHLAIVFGPHIRSRSLDAVRPGETERDRMIRGAYVGRLHPGRTSSRIEQLKREERRNGVKAGPVGQAQPAAASPPSAASSSTASTITTAAPPTSEDQEGSVEVHEKAPVVRIHSECYTGETVWSARCDCGEQLDEAARIMALPSNATGGVIIYLRQEGRGIGLSEKLKAYNLQDLGHDTYEANLLLRHPADARSYGLATAMLVDLGLGGERGIRLLTNNPDKVRAVEGPNREVVVKERVAMIPLAWQTHGEKGVRSEEVEKYLSTKIEKFKHMLSQ